MYRKHATLKTDKEVEENIKRKEKMEEKTEDAYNEFSISFNESCYRNPITTASTQEMKKTKLF